MRSAAIAAGVLLLGGTGCATTPPLAPEGHAVGIVFSDRNGNGTRDRFEWGVHGVAVSNGRDVVRTDWHGRYSLPVGDDTIVFVVKPRGFTTPVDANGLPRFHYVHKPAGSPAQLRFPGVAPTGPLPASVDFPLRRRREPDEFQMLLFGDTQPYRMEEVDLLARDVVDDLVGADVAFGMTLGDLVGDDLSLFEPLNEVVGRIGVPWYHVIGNHDMNFRADDDRHADETYERVYGPGTFAFEYGPVHFIVLDDVVYGGLVEGNTAQNYVGGLNEDQLEFVSGYLEGVPKSALVVIAMHIPLKGPTPRLDVPERDRLLALLAGRPHSFSMSAHTHFQANDFYGPDEGFPGPGRHHHLNQATVDGSWWQGLPDERGIPHATMRCGAPNGYSIVTFDGSDYRVRFYPAGRPADHQMNVYTPASVASADAGETEVVVNVFAGSERSSVEMRVDDGPWTPLAREERADPYYVEILEREKWLVPRMRPLPPPVPSPHLWVGTLPATLRPGTRTLEVRTRDMYGQVFRATRLIRVE